MGETGVDVLGCASVVEGGIKVAVKVESVGAVVGGEHCVCVFFFVVSVPEVGGLVETEEDALPDIADDDTNILEELVKLGRGNTLVRDIQGVLSPEFVVEPGAEVVELPGHGNE